MYDTESNDYVSASHQFSLSSDDPIWALIA